MPWAYVLSSNDFSKPVCRYPISGSASRTRSPSSLSRTRSTPCVLGCWGPMLRSIHSASGSCSGPKKSTPNPWVVVVSATDGVGLQPFEFRVAENHRLAKGDIVLAQGMSFPGFRHQDAAEIGVTIEGDAQQIPGLPLMPVGRRPDAGQAGNVRIGHGGGCFDSNPGFVLQGPHFPDHSEAWIARRPVDGRGIEEVVEAFLVLEVARHLDDGLGRDDDTEVAAEFRALGQGIRKTLADPPDQRVGGGSLARWRRAGGGVHRDGFRQFGAPTARRGFDAAA